MLDCRSDGSRSRDWGEGEDLSLAIEYKTIVTESIAAQIADSIRRAIIDGELAVDQRLPTEEELAQRFSVSRPTVREALKRLAAQNLIRSRRGPTGGTFVNRPDQAQVREALTGAATMLVTLGEFDLDAIAEARRELELGCVALAVERREAAHLERMAEEIAIQESDVDDAGFCASDIRLHRALVDATGNPVLQFVMFAVIEALQPVSNLVVFRFRDRARVVAQHRQLLEALHSRDAPRARAALEEQMADLRDQYAEAQAWRRARDEERR